MVSALNYSCQAGNLPTIIPPANVRDELDIIFHINDKSIDIAELRPVWRGDQGEKVEHSAAKMISPLEKFIK
ncbi:hypothetical protein ACS78O_09035 [Yersinia enterocolitica]|uniref:hypothetical protein n=1 Tax=Yersinia enterocolitica TaxID=630 RepID=UPI00067BC9B3|nr:hypothetical protein [Yersinia enterocolitica]HEN3491785.1 hypothetical protein [Yersinia enterocolitica]